MKKFWKVLTTLLFGVLLLSACALIEPMYGRGDIYPVAFNHWSNGECYWIPGGGLNRIHCPRIRQYSPFGIGIPFWWNAGPMYNNRYNYYRPYYVPQYIPPTRNEPSRQDGNGVVTRDGYKETPPEPPKRKAKPRTGGRGWIPFSDKEVPLRERMPWLWPSCDPNCGRPSQELEFRLKEFEQFKLDTSERFEQFKRNEHIRYTHTPIMEE